MDKGVQRPKSEKPNIDEAVYSRPKKEWWRAQIARGTRVQSRQEELSLDMNVKGNNGLPLPSDSFRVKTNLADSTLQVSEYYNPNHRRRPKHFYSK